ncbi:hypothetical protein [Euzebya rosea]|uniref:hypothetical protein n=1 Tax=Euzebya rosea TaxID=2052804 RepID=UPI000D3E7A9A|nr:hypothetical protein [Euzebya rosea]
MDQSRHTTAPAWEDQQQLLVDLAVDDLRAGLDIRPTMVAFDADGPLFLATVRPFDKGRHHDAIIEVGALAMALQARRLAISLGGRAWSQDDPIPPVLPDVGDLRQRVLVVHSVDAANGPADCRTTVWPVRGARVGEDVSLGDPVASDDGVGWVVDAMAVMVDPRNQEPVSEQEVAEQVIRCDRLGHQLAWSGPGLVRLDRAMTAHFGGPWLAGEAA